MIEWLRSKLGKIVVGSIFISMLLFVGGDIFYRYSGFFNRDEIPVLEFRNGKISYADFNEMEEKIIATRFRTREIDQQTRSQLIDELRDEIVFENVFEPEFSKAGLFVSRDEIRDAILSKEPSPVVISLLMDPRTGKLNPNFTDENGKYSPEKMQAYLNFLLQNPSGQDFIQRLEKDLKRNSLASKYSSLIRSLASFYSVKEAILDLEENSKKHTFVLLSIPYENVNINEKVDNKELTSFYNDKCYGPAFYNEQDSKDITYILFEVLPTTADTQLAKDKIEAIKKRWIETSGNSPSSQKDSDFVLINGGDISVFSIYDFQYLPDSVVLSIPENKITEPYISEKGYTIAKVLETRLAPDSVRASHILLPYERDSATFEKLADSLLDVIKRGTTPFDTLALRYSKDESSADKGGDLGWFREGAIIKPISDSCFLKKKGDIFKVRTQFGLHIVKITDQTKPVKKFLLARIYLPVEPQKQTRDSVYNAASRFYSNLISKRNDYEFFISSGKKYGAKQFTGITPQIKNIPGVELPVEVRRWIHQAEEHAISKIYELPEGYLIIGIDAVHKKGRKQPKEIISFVTDEFIKTKKFEYVVSASKGIIEIERLKEKWNGKLDTITDLSFSSMYIPGIGYEPAVIGAVYWLEPGQTTPFVKGNSAIYIAKVISRTDPEKPSTLLIDRIIQQKSKNYSSILDNLLTKIIFEHYRLKDYRNLHY